MEIARASLHGRIAAVTGAGGGLGRVIASELAGHGAHVLVVDRDDSGARHTVETIEAVGGSAEPLVLDVLEDESAMQVMWRAHELGGLDVLVNNAGGWTPGENQYPDAEAPDWSRTLDLDLRVPMLWTQHVLRGDRTRGRVVVNVSSSAALGPSPYGSPEYAVSKAGLVRLTTSLADAEERYGVRVVCVVPGWIGLERAEIAYAALSDAERAAIPPLVPPDLVAGLVVDAVLDPAARSGTVIHALGGDVVEVLPPP